MITRRKVEDAVYSVFAEAYRTEAVCEIEPIIQVTSLERLQILSLDVWTHL